MAIGIEIIFAVRVEEQYNVANDALNSLLPNTIGGSTILVGVAFQSKPGEFSDRVVSLISVLEDRVGYFQGLFIGEDALRALLLPFVPIYSFNAEKLIRRFSNFDAIQHNWFRLETSNNQNTDIISLEERIAISNWNTTARPDVWLHSSLIVKQYYLLQSFVNHKMKSNINNPVVLNEDTKHLLRFSIFCRSSDAVFAGYILSLKNIETSSIDLFKRFYENVARCLDSGFIYGPNANVDETPSESILTKHLLPLFV